MRDDYERDRQNWYGRSYDSAEDAAYEQRRQERIDKQNAAWFYEQAVRIEMEERREAA